MRMSGFQTDRSGKSLADYIHRLAQIQIYPFCQAPAVRLDILNMTPAGLALQQINFLLNDAESLLPVWPGYFEYIDPGQKRRGYILNIVGRQNKDALAAVEIHLQKYVTEFPCRSLLQ